jgi:hypothetical protein
MSATAMSATALSSVPSRRTRRSSARAASTPPGRTSGTTEVDGGDLAASGDAPPLAEGGGQAGLASVRNRRR